MVLQSIVEARWWDIRRNWDVYRREALKVTLLIKQPQSKLPHVIVARAKSRRSRGPMGQHRQLSEEREAYRSLDDNDFGYGLSVMFILT